MWIGWLASTHLFAVSVSIVVWAKDRCCFIPPSVAVSSLPLSRTMRRLHWLNPRRDAIVGTLRPLVSPSPNRLTPMGQLAFAPLSRTRKPSFGSSSHNIIIRWESAPPLLLSHPLGHCCVYACRRRTNSRSDRVRAVVYKNGWDDDWFWGPGAAIGFWFGCMFVTLTSDTERTLSDRLQLVAQFTIVGALPQFGPLILLAAVIWPPR